ncbi:MAG: hypothetical protein PHR83_10380 [Paludibacter sp.]|nr:hypothetical protein [Paludibacter sp.]
MNKRNLVLLFAILLCKLSIFAQADFIPGYIQTNEYDSIYGLIDFRGDQANNIECRFKKTATDAIQTFSPRQLYGYGFENSKHYVSKELKSKEETKTIFLEYLVRGVVDLYFYRDLKGDHYLVGKNDLPIKEVSLPDEIISIDGVNYERNILINPNLLKFYLHDCPEIFPDIDRLKIATHKSLIQLIKKYHDIHCPNDVCLIYQKKMPKFRVDIQPIVGFANFNMNGPLGNLYNINFPLNKFMFQYGVLSYFWLPLVNEKIFLKTGLIINRMKGYIADSYSVQRTYLEESSIKIPLQVHYQFLNTNITPVIGGGLNLYSTPTLPFAVFPTLNAGVNARITEKVYATLSSDLDYFSPIFIVPINASQIISYSFNLGLAIKL